MAMLKINARVAKPLRQLAYPCQICGVIGHILSNCPKFNKMKHVKKKGNKTPKKKSIVDVKVMTKLINMVDVHVATTRSKETKVHVFREWEPKKNKIECHKLGSKKTSKEIHG